MLLQGCQCAAACATIFREGKTLRCVKTSSILLLDKNCRKLETWFQAFQEMKKFVQGWRQSEACRPECRASALPGGELWEEGEGEFQKYEFQTLHKLLIFSN